MDRHVLKPLQFIMKCHNNDMILTDSEPEPTKPVPLESCNRYENSLEFQLGFDFIRIMQ